MEPQAKETERVQRYIEIEAPEFLEKGQNFYDQPPFEKILDEISEQTDTEVSRLRIFLSTFAGILRSHLQIEPITPQDIAWRISRKYPPSFYPALSKAVTAARRESTDREKYLNAGRMITQRLADYPYWNEYVPSQREQPTYKRDGSYSPVAHKDPFYPPAETYASWATKKIRLQINKVVKGVEEVFPQDFGQEQLPTHPQKERSETKRWRILKASELIPEKR